MIAMINLLKCVDVNANVKKKIGGIFTSNSPAATQFSVIYLFIYL